MTNERKLHILDKHEVLEDCKNIDTLFFLSNLENNNLNVVVKLNTKNNKKNPKNSVMTAWIIRNSNLKKLREKNKSIYKKE